MSIKTEKVARLIKDRVANIILHEIADPRMGFVTVTKVEVAPDFKTAKVHVSILGNEGQQSLTMHGLKHAGGHIQHLLGGRLRVRNTPQLSFVQDRSSENAIRLSKLIDRAVAGETAEDLERRQAEPEEWPLEREAKEEES